MLFLEFSSRICFQASLRAICTAAQNRRFPSNRRLLCEHPLLTPVITVLSISNFGIWSPFAWLLFCKSQMSLCFGGPIIRQLFDLLCREITASMWTNTNSLYALELPRPLLGRMRLGVLLNALLFAVPKIAILVASGASIQGCPGELGLYPCVSGRRRQAILFLFGSCGDACLSFLGTGLPQSVFTGSGSPSASCSDARYTVTLFAALGIAIAAATLLYALWLRHAWVRVCRRSKFCRACMYVATFVS